VFTPYFGAFSHHLNYMTLFPGLHWMFAPETNMAAVRSLLQTPRFAHLAIDDFKLAAPRRSFNSKRTVLPTLNGMTGKEYASIVCDTGFSIETLRVRPLLEKFRILGRIGSRLNGLLCSLPYLDEMLSLNLISVLRKA
jgi:hypothetical protein